MSYEPESYGPEPRVAADKTSAPGIFLIITGILNVLGALGYLGVAGVFLAMPTDQIEKMIEQQPAEQRKNLETEQ